MSSNPTTFLQRHLAGVPPRLDVVCVAASNWVHLRLVVVDRLVNVLLWQDIQTHVRPLVVRPNGGTGQDVSSNYWFEDSPVTGSNRLHEEFLCCHVNAPEHALLWHGTTAGVAWLSACSQSLIDDHCVPLATDWPRLVEQFCRAQVPDDSRLMGHSNLQFHSYSTVCKHAAE